MSNGSRFPWWAGALVTSGVLFLIVLIIELAGGDAKLWTTVPGELGRFVDQCELPKLDRIARQRWGAMSNVAYLASGAFMLFRAGHTKTRSWRILGAVLGGATLFLGFGSYVFHASMTGWGQTLDIMGIYGVLGALSAAIVWRFICAIVDDPLAGPGWGLLSLLALFGFAGIARETVRSLPVMIGFIVLVALLFIIMVCVKTWAYDDWENARRLMWQFGLSVLFFGVAGSLQLTDGYELKGSGLSPFDLLSHPDPTEFRKAITCIGPDAFFQAHALWHLFGAIAIAGLHDTFASPDGRMLFPRWD